MRLSNPSPRDPSRLHRRMARDGPVAGGCSNRAGSGPVPGAGGDLLRRGTRLTYRFQSEIEPIVPLRLKIEIDTREHDSVMGFIEASFRVDSGWFTGSTTIPTYSIDELMGTKLRALYQRRKGRDLFDLWLVIEHDLIEPEAVVRCFLAHLASQGLRVSRAEFEENLYAKTADRRFLSDVAPLLRDEQCFDPDHAFVVVKEELIARIPGDPWRGAPE